MRADQKKQIQEIISLFRHAERLVKRIEELEGALSIPSINELRYVGYHLCCALVGDGCLDPQDAPTNETADALSEDERFDIQIVSAIRIQIALALTCFQHICFQHIPKVLRLAR